MKMNFGRVLTRSWTLALSRRGGGVKLAGQVKRHISLLGIDAP
jgi:hypothetical protein